MLLERPRGRRHPVGAAILALPFLILWGCSFGPPNLAPILQDREAEPSSGVIVSMKYETARSYRLNHPNSVDSKDSLMEFISCRYSIAAIPHLENVIFVPFFHDVFLNPGLGVGLKQEGWYALAAFDFLILDKGDFSPHSPHFGAQAGVRLTRFAILTYDYFRLAYMDFESTAYGWEVLYKRESGASRLSLALGRVVYAIPGVIYVHQTGDFGWTLNLTAGFGKPVRKGPVRP